MLTSYINESFAKCSQQSTQALVQIDEMPESASIATHNRERIGTLYMRTKTEEKVIPINRNQRVTFGRNSNCEQVISHSAVSNEHFTIYSVVFDETNTPLVYCQDRSRNGTFFNGRTIGKGHSVLLSNLDRIEIRHACSIVFHQDNERTLLDLILRDDSKEMPEYEISQRVIGKGTFGKVFLATSRLRARQLACKIIETNGAISRMTRAKMEVSILQRLCHPNVVTVHDTYVIKNRIYIFEDLITGGDLFSYLVRGETLSPISETEALVIIFQILKALQYLHSCNVVHRDLKLDNILLVTHSPGARVVLIDFGISKYVVGGRRMTTVVGTPEFSAPEVGFDDLLRENHPRTGYDKKCDMWSLGVILHILLSGMSPFYDPSENAALIARNAREGRLYLSSSAWTTVSSAAKDFVRKLICVNPVDRLSVGECFDHPWIAAHLDELENIYSKKIVADWMPPVSRPAISVSQSTSFHMDSLGEDAMEDEEVSQDYRPISPGSIKCRLLY
ncbi:kinase-like domain-containing protein [Dipodascopsis uninucleata]